MYRSRAGLPPFLLGFLIFRLSVNQGLPIEILCDRNREIAPYQTNPYSARMLCFRHFMGKVELMAFMNREQRPRRQNLIEVNIPGFPLRVLGLMIVLVSQDKSPGSTERKHNNMTVHVVTMSAYDAFLIPVAVDLDCVEMCLILLLDLRV